MAQQVGYLPGSTGNAPSGAPGFDTDTKLTSAHVQDFVNAGYEFCVRYLSLGSPQDTSSDLDYHEGVAILNAGLGLMAVQHTRMAPWTPTATLGSTDGENARTNAYYVGFPAHVNIWLDLEGISSGTSVQTVIDYCNNWYDAVAAWGYIPGLYVGANSILTGNQLYYNLKFQHYWKSLSNVVTPTSRGYQLVQSYEQPYYGVAIDRDTAHTDNMNGQTQWLHI